MARVFNYLPGVLSFSRTLSMTDVALFNEIDGQYEHTPVRVIRHGISGTQNTNKAPKDTDSVAMVQETDTAKTASEAEAMIALTSLRFMPLTSALHACAAGAGEDKENMVGVRDSINDFIARAIDSTGIKTIALRYARNLLNGRWLWRNRVVATGIEVKIFNHQQAGRPNLAIMTPAVIMDNAFSLSLHHFDHYTEEEHALADIIEMNLNGDMASTIIMEARITFGVAGALQVFPSENFIQDKPSGFARSLYCLGKPEKKTGTSLRVMGYAAIREQKASNAIRTIDTWYPDFEVIGRPIPVEPNGANLSDQTFYRAAKSKYSAFSLFKRLNELDPTSPEGLFVIAALIRGGVYSEGSKNAASKVTSKDNTEVTPAAVSAKKNPKPKAIKKKAVKTSA